LVAWTDIKMGRIRLHHAFGDSPPAVDAITPGWFFNRRFTGGRSGYNESSARVRPLNVAMVLLPVKLNPQVIVRDAEVLVQGGVDAASGAFGGEKIQGRES